MKRPASRTAKGIATASAFSDMSAIRQPDGGPTPTISFPIGESLQSLTPVPNAAAASTYLLQLGGRGLRWNRFPTPVVFLSHGMQPGAPNGGLTALSLGLAAWTNDPNSNIVLQYGGTTPIAQSGIGDTPTGTADGVNTVQFNDPSNEIMGSFPAKGTLAIGGAWSNGSTHTLNGETFLTIVE